MTRLHRSILITLVGVLTLCGAARAQSGNAAFLFAYDVDRGKEDAFEAGYAAHLDWHAAHGDVLPWYGWYVTSGPRTGLFIDGTFGIPFEAMDRRVDPAGDGADMTAKVLLYAKARTSSALELWPEVSTTRTLEDRQPSAVLEVLSIYVKPADVSSFETILAGSPRSSTPSVTWYRLVSGGQVGTYLVFIPRQNWADLAGRPRSVEGWFAAAYGPQVARAAALVSAVEIETWSYRPTLSRLP